MIRFFAIGDVFGKIGRWVLKNFLNDIINEESIDFVIANVENVTGGKGISKKHYEELKNIGVKIMTSGNHIFYLKETEDYISETADLLRPLNFSYYPGNGTVIFDLKGKKIRVTNLIGQDLMPCKSESPYLYIDKILNLESKNIDFKSDIHLIDFHAEATGEKNALALYYDGLITAIWGTHTHVQTSDERILEKGTGFISDLGMTGAYGGVIGADLSSVIRRSKYNLPSKIIPFYECTFGQINGAIFEINDNNKISFIKRINNKYHR